MTARVAIATRVAVAFLTLMQVVFVAAKVFYLRSSAGSIAFGVLMLLVTAGVTWVTFNQTARWLR